MQIVQRALTLTLTLLATLMAPAVAQTVPEPQSVTITATAPLPLSEYGKLPDYQQPILSPNGQYLAVLVPIKGRSNLAVIDLGNMKSNVLTSIDRYDVLDVYWVGNDRLVFTMGARNEPTGPGVADGGGLFMVHRDGSESRVLSPTIREVRTGNAQRLAGLRSGYLDTQPLAAVPDSTTDIYVSEYGRTADGADVYRLDVSTGKRTLITATRPERVTSYALDRDRVPRFAVSLAEKDSTQIYWYRDTADSGWRELTRFTDLAAKGGLVGFVVLGFHSDNKSLIVSASAGSDTAGLHVYDVDNKKFGEMLVNHPRYDIRNGIWDPKTRTLIGAEVNGDKREVVWFDEGMAKTQASIDKAFPDRFNVIRRAADSKRAVVTSMSDVAPPSYFLYDEATRKIEPLIAAMPWLKPGHLVAMRAFELKTRDGLSIPSFYFLPKSYKQGEKLPTVVHIHGGPQVRADSWGPLMFGGTGVWEAQVLASRGYAVVLPNFRVTPGLGAKISLAGKHSLGRAMSEDHEDAAKWAVSQGFADPARMCITGASYGGYATLRALAKTPELFKCGIAGLSVSDWELIATSTSGDTAYSATGAKYIDSFLIGSDKPGAARDVSPVHQAALMKAPLMMYAGAADIRTPIEQTNRMVSALRKEGKEPELLIKTEEGHGFGVLANRVELWEKMLTFLDKHIGTGPTKPN